MYGSQRVRRATHDLRCNAPTDADRDARRDAAGQTGALEQGSGSQTARSNREGGRESAEEARRKREKEQRLRGRETQSVRERKRERERVVG